MSVGPGPGPQRRAWRSARAWLALTLSLGAHHDARAQEAPPAQLPLTLEWIAPEGCPSAEAVERHARSAVQVPAGTTLPTVHARVVVVASAQGFTMRMDTTRDGELGSREVQGTSCVALAQAATLILALTFGAGVDLSATLAESLAAEGAGEAREPPDAGAGERDATAVVSTEPAAEVERDVSATPAPAPEALDSPVPDAPPPEDAEAPAALRMAARLGLALVVGPLPRAAPGPLLGVGVVRSRVALHLGLVALPRSEAPVPGVDVEQRYRSFLAEAALCLAPRAGAVGVAPCLRVSAGSIHAASVGADRDGSARAAYVAPGVGLQLTLPRERWASAGLTLALDIPALRPRFTITNVGLVHRVSPWALTLAATLQLTTR